MSGSPLAPFFRAASASAVILVALASSPSASAAELVPVPNDLPATLDGATLVGDVDPAQPMSVAIVLPLRNAAAAEAFATAASTRGNPQFHHFLTPEQFAQRFGASANDYAALLAWARSQGLQPGETYAARTVLPVNGSSAAIAAAFNIHFHTYKSANGMAFFAADRAPAVTQDVAARIAAVLGLSNKTGFASLLRVRPATAAPLASGTAPNGAYAASDLRTAYSVQPQNTRVRLETVALFEQGGFDPNDIAVYAKSNKLAPVPVIARSVNGSGTAITNPGIDLEAALDIDMLIGINPSLRKIVVYEDGIDSFGVALLDSLSAMATENTAQTVSISYGTDEISQGRPQMHAENELFTQMAAQGQGVFVSAGDQGAYGRSFNGRNVEDPGSQSFVVSVGGTTLFTNNQQQRLFEITWNELAGAGFATGGGISRVFPIPSYQVANGQPVTTMYGGSATRRNVPDVTAVGDPFTGVAVYSALNGGWLQVGGTSASAPIWAGLASIADADSRLLSFGQLGFLNPVFTGLETFGDPSFLGVDFLDIVDGNNGIPNDPSLPPGFSAGAGQEFRSGYDNVSGWGAPGATLVTDLALISVPVTFGGPPAPTGLGSTATPTTITLTWRPVAGVNGYLANSFSTATGFSVGAIIAKFASATFTGLAPASTYQLSACSVNITGAGCSSQIYVTTPAQ